MDLSILMPVKEAKSFTPEEIDSLRQELRACMKGHDNGYTDAQIEEILMFPPIALHMCLRAFVVVFGPLSQFSVADYPYSALVEDDLKPRGPPPDPVIADGRIYLADALTALADYNNLLEGKIAKFNIQSIRSLASIRESADADLNITAIYQSITEVKAQKLLHKQQIDLLRASFDSRDEKMSLVMEECETLFKNEALFLNCYDTFFEEKLTLRPTRQTYDEKKPWAHYDYILTHLEGWRRLIRFNHNTPSPSGEQVIDRARRLVSEMVYAVTQQCQAQLATVFYEHSLGRVPASDHHQVVHDEAVAIAKEIDWLWEEVIPVAHMCVSAQFLAPVLRRRQDWEETKMFREAVITTYTSGVLRFMNERLSAVTERTQILVYHHQALYSGAWVRQLKEASSPIDMVPQDMPRTSSQFSMTLHRNATTLEHLQLVMDYFAVVPIRVGNPYPKPTSSVLDEYVQNRAQKGDTLLQDLHKLFEAATKSGLADTELGGDLLLESLLADSSASPVQPGSVYRDSQLEGSIELLRGQSSSIQEMFKDLNLDGPAKAPDFVAHAYRQTVDRLAAKVGVGCFRGGENPSPTCWVCIRCLKFEEFVRRWGC